MVAGEIVGKIEVGETIVNPTLAVFEAEVYPDGDESVTEDGFLVKGAMTFPDQNEVVAVDNETLTIVLGTYAEVVPAGSFEWNDAQAQFVLERDPVTYSGITEMKFSADGSFTIEAHNLDLSEIAFPKEIAFGLQAGNDVASEILPFDEDGEYAAPVIAASAATGTTPDLRVGPENITVEPREAAAYTVELGGDGVFAGKQVSLFCADLPAHASCLFTPQTLTLGPDGGTSQLIVTTNGTDDRQRRNGRTALVIGFGLVFGLIGFGVGPRRRRTWMAHALVLATAGIFAACSDDPLGPSPIDVATPPGDYKFKVVATAGDVEQTFDVRLSVQEPNAPMKLPGAVPQEVIDKGAFDGAFSR